MDDLTNQFIGGYHFQWRIAQGGMAAVYVGQRIDDPDAPQVALKVLDPRLAVNPVARKRFQREAELGQRLKHRHIVQVFDLVEASGHVFMVMQYMAGGSLAERLIQEDALPWPAAVRVLQQIGQALEYAHAQGIVHRDVKPSNILFDESGNAYLADFGVAHVEEASTLTAAGFQPGTVAYMSPEQIQGLDVDAGSDQFSLAVVFYHMLTGMPPFEGATTAALTYQIVHKSPKRLPKRPDIPKGAQKVLARAMAKDPNDRYPDVMSFVRAMMEVEPSRAGGIIGKMVRIAALALMILLLGGAAFLFLRDRPHTIAFLAASTTISTPTPSPTTTPTPTSTPLSPTPLPLTPTQPLPAPTDTPLPTVLASPAVIISATGEMLTPTSERRAVQDEAPTPTLVPTETPTPTRKPIPTRNPTPISTPTPTQPAPQSFQIWLAPLQPNSQGEVFIFRWGGDDLPSGLAYEPVIWRTGGSEDLLRFGMSPTGIVEMRRVQADLKVIEGVEPLQLSSGHDYYWGVCIVQKDPYKRLYCSEGRPFRYQRESGGGGGGGACPPDC